MAILTVSRPTYERLARRASAMRRRPDELADELLNAHVEATGHPHVTRQEGVRGGRSVLRGSSIPVWLVIAMWKAGDTPDEIAQAYPYLRPAAIYDAISYYFDHREDVEAEIAENHIERVLADVDAVMDEQGVVGFSQTNARR